MIKKSTLIVLLAAILAGAAAYYFDWKRGQKDAEKTAADTAKLAFSLQADDISSLTISYPADPKSQPIHFEKQNGAWQITAPLQTGADEPSLQGILQQLASARVAQTEPGTPRSPESFWTGYSRGYAGFSDAEWRQTPRTGQEGFDRRLGLRPCGQLKRSSLAPRIPARQRVNLCRTCAIIPCCT